MSSLAATAEAPVPPAADAAPAVASVVALPTVDDLMEEAPPQAEPVETPSRYRLPQAAMPPDIKLQAAVARLVAQKERIDQLVREALLDGLLPVHGRADALELVWYRSNECHLIGRWPLGG